MIAQYVAWILSEWYGHGFSSPYYLDMVPVPLLYGHGSSFPYYLDMVPVSPTIWTCFQFPLLFGHGSSFPYYLDMVSLPHISWTWFQFPLFLDMVPVPPAITAITFAFTFHIRWIPLWAICILELLLLLLLLLLYFLLITRTTQFVSNISVIRLIGLILIY